jgi:polysaccharide export outer membrane protein
MNKSSAGPRRPSLKDLTLWICFSIACITIGCQSPKSLLIPSASDAGPYVAPTIQIGDRITATFPGATNLNLSQVIRVDGTLHLDNGRDIPVLDKTPKSLQTNLLDIFGPELIVKDVSVLVEPAGYPIFVSGAVLHPGKFLVNRPVTVLEAIMEAGGYDANKANLSKVRVVRQDRNRQRTYEVDVQRILENPSSPAFHLWPSDVVIVPERFVFF